MAIKDLFINPVNYFRGVIKKYPFWFDLTKEVIVYGFLLSIIAIQIFAFPFSILGWIAWGLLWHFFSVELVHVAGNYRGALR